MNKWKCTVCGYIHEGAEPPERCPKCGAPKEKFVSLEDSGKEPEPRQTDREAAPASWANTSRFCRLVSSLRLHPISVHAPNGLLPASSILLILGNLFSSESLKVAGVYNLIICLCAMPVVLFSGYCDWQLKLAGKYTKIIVTKIVCGVVTGLLGLVLFVWWLVGGEIGVPYLLFQLLMLCAAGLAGHLGGKIVFEGK